MMTLMMVTMLSICLASCGGDDDDSPAGNNPDNNGSGNNTELRGWYYYMENGNFEIPQSAVPYDFDASGLLVYKEISERRTWPIEILHFIDNTTCVHYSLGLLWRKDNCTPAKSGCELLYQFNAGPLGTLAYYRYNLYNNKSWTTYSCRREGNEIVILGYPNIITIKSNGLEWMGHLYKKYDPDKVY